MLVKIQNSVITKPFAVCLSFMLLFFTFQSQTAQAANPADFENGKLIRKQKVEVQAYLCNTNEHPVINELIAAGKDKELTEYVTLKAGTPVTLQTTQQISSQYAMAGQSIDFRVVYDVSVDGKVVIPAGSVAKGTVVNAQKPKMFGKPGIISIQVKSVQAADGQQISLSSNTQMREGDNKKALAWILFGVSLIILWPLIFVPFFLKGKNAEIPQGMNIDANTTTNVNIAIE